MPATNQTHHQFEELDRSLGVMCRAIKVARHIGYQPRIEHDYCPFCEGEAVTFNDWMKSVENDAATPTAAKNTRRRLLALAAVALVVISGLSGLSVERLVATSDRPANNVERSGLAIAEYPGAGLGIGTTADNHVELLVTATSPHKDMVGVYGWARGVDQLWLVVEKIPEDRRAAKTTQTIIVGRPDQALIDFATSNSDSIRFSIPAHGVFAGVEKHAVNGYEFYARRWDLFDSIAGSISYYEEIIR